MKFLPLIAASALSVVMTVSSIAQTKDERKYAEVKSWWIYSLSNDGQFEGCAAEIQKGPDYLRIWSSFDSWYVATMSDKSGNFNGGIAVDGTGDGVTYFGNGTGWASANYPPEPLRAGRTVSLDVGQGYIDFPLSGSTAAMGKVTECLDRQGKPKNNQTAEAPTANTAFSSESDAHRMGLDCPELGTRSTQSSVPARIEIVNRIDADEGMTTIYWLDFDGNPVAYGDLTPGAGGSVTFDTYVGHKWIAKDFSGTCHGGLFVAAPGLNKFMAH